MPWSVENFPPKQDLETRKILKKTSQASRYLAELKGLARSIPNQSILISTLTLQEAKDSSEIENIITTYDDIFKANRNKEATPPATKEVYYYADALLVGFNAVVDNGFLSLNHIIDIHSTLSNSEVGFRKQPGVELKNERTGETIYISPQHRSDTETYLTTLENYINTPSIDQFDELVRMALIHHQFESIHPFADGNGRTGRILNMLYLVLQDRIDIPILYLSRYITSTKSEYYRLLQHVRDTGEWEEWVLYILEGIEQTAKHMLIVVQMIKEMMLATKSKMRSELKIYSQDLLNVIYQHPYTRTQNLIEVLKISRPTATKYLNALAQQNIVTRTKIGNDVYYINDALVTLLVEIPTFGKQ